MSGTELAKIRLPLTTFMPALRWAIPAAFVPVTVVAAFVSGKFDEILVAGTAAVAGITPVVFSICAVCALTYHVRVHADGVSSYDPWGSWKRDFLAWEEMSQITKVSVLGVAYFRIDSDENKSLWIPERVFGESALRSAVQEIAPGSRIAAWTSIPPKG